MDIRSTVITALASLSAPVYWVKWRGQGSPPSTYITFQSVNRPSFHTDDKADEREHYVYLDVFSEADPYTTAESVRTNMKAAGFEEVEMRDVGQETMSVTELKDFHVAFTFKYTEDL